MALHFQLQESWSWSKRHSILCIKCMSNQSYKSAQHESHRNSASSDPPQHLRPSLKLSRWAEIQHEQTPGTWVGQVWCDFSAWKLAELTESSSTSAFWLAENLSPRRIEPRPVRVQEGDVGRQVRRQVWVAENHATSPRNGVTFECNRPNVWQNWHRVPCSSAEVARVSMPQTRNSTSTGRQHHLPRPSPLPVVEGSNDLIGEIRWMVLQRLVHPKVVQDSPQKFWRSGQPPPREKWRTRPPPFASVKMTNALVRSTKSEVHVCWCFSKHISGSSWPILGWQICWRTSKADPNISLFIALEVLVQTLQLWNLLKSFNCNHPTMPEVQKRQYWRNSRSGGQEQGCEQGCCFNGAKTSGSQVTRTITWRTDRNAWHDKMGLSWWVLCFVAQHDAPAAHFRSYNILCAPRAIGILSWIQSLF